MRPHVLMLSATRPVALRRLEEGYVLHRLDGASDWAATLRAHGPAIRAIVANGHAPVDEALLAQLPALEILCCSSAGYDAFDLHALARRGVRLTNASPALAQEVADVALLLVLAGWRKIVQADAWVREGHWAQEGDFPLGRGHRGRRLGVVGMGTIGQKVADLAKTLGFQVSFWNRSPKQMPYPQVHDLVELARDSDILVAVVAGGEGTRGLISAPVIEALGPDGLLVNVARGSVVDESALIAALSDGWLGGAALDVFASEPDANPRLTSLPNVTLSPHQASATVETRDAMAELMVDNLDAHFAGRPLPSQVRLPAGQGAD